MRILIIVENINNIYRVIWYHWRILLVVLNDNFLNLAYTYLSEKNMILKLDTF